MIPLTANLCQSDDDESTENSPWQKELARAIKDPLELLAAVGLNSDDVPGGIDSQQVFPLRVPRNYVARMRTGDPTDPLLLQVLPRQLESAIQPGFLRDPVGDTAATTCPGLLHKYYGRVLLITTGACPVHCRYCFRRHFPYAKNRPDDHQWTAAARYIAARPEITEVILSGGDPLSLSTERLTEISNALRHIPHLRRLRIHTRMPIVLPERIDDNFLRWLSSQPWQSVLVTHCNHPNELSHDVRHALNKLRDIGVTLLNQAVLLKDVNNSVSTQCTLSESLFASGVLPYYLHLLDRVQGAEHFDVPETTAVTLMNKIRQQLPGFLVPQLVREITGQPHKTPINHQTGSLDAKYPFLPGVLPTHQT
ncbi:MAG: EF-P beta-lysylation protein EpmB [Gammaproteobacteria bacterium]|nr:EF-P beta-lysylation protein EpmB [Gammaproteobacteria bacterium]